MGQTPEVQVRLGQRKGTTDEADGAVVAEVGRQMRALVGAGGDFRVSSQIDAAEQDAAPGRFAEPETINGEARERHGVSSICRFRRGVWRAFRVESL